MRTPALCSSGSLFVRVIRVLIGALALSSPAFGQETGDRSITGHELWKAADGPYTIHGVVTVEEHATLTIEPGTTVEFVPDFRSGIAVRGQLLAEGRPSEPITLRLAGRRQADTPAKWRGVWIDRSSATASLSEVVLSDAIVGLDVSSGSADLVS